MSVVEQPIDVQPVEVEDAIATKLDAQALAAAFATLVNAQTDIPTIAASLEADFGERPRLQISITSPPTLPIATCLGIAATAPDADAAVRALASGVVAAVQAQAVVVSKG